MYGFLNTIKLMADRSTFFYFIKSNRFPYWKQPKCASVEYYSAKTKTETKTDSWYMQPLGWISNLKGYILCGSMYILFWKQLYRNGGQISGCQGLGVVGNWLWLERGSMRDIYGNETILEFDCGGDKTTEN